MTVGKIAGKFSIERIFHEGTDSIQLPGLIKRFPFAFTPVLFEFACKTGAAGKFFRLRSVLLSYLFGNCKNIDEGAVFLRYILGK
jgi:hypothetical protein